MGLGSLPILEWDAQPWGQLLENPPLAREPAPAAAGWQDPVTSVSPVPGPSQDLRAQALQQHEEEPMFRWEPLAEDGGFKVPDPSPNRHPQSSLPQASHRDVVSKEAQEHVRQPVGPSSRPKGDDQRRAHHAEPVAPKAPPASLHDAVKRGDLERVQAVLSAAATAPQRRTLVNKKNAQGRPPLHLAAEGGHLAVVEALVAAGAQVDETEEGYGCGTALMWAAANGHLAVVKALLAAGADPRIVAHDGSTAERNAREGGFNDIADLLRGQAAHPSPRHEAGRAQEQAQPPVDAWLAQIEAEEAALLAEVLSLDRRHGSLGAFGAAAPGNSPPPPAQPRATPPVEPLHGRRQQKPPRPPRLM